MPFEVQKINPIDLQPRKAVGISIPFSASGVFNSTYQTKDAIKVNIINFFLTGRGERFMNPTFGTGLRNLLFEQLTEGLVRKINSQIRLDLEKYFPRVIVKDLAFKEDPGNNTINFLLKYSIESSNIEDEIIINFER